MAPRRYYPFKHRDPVSGTWIKARYKAELHVIAARHAEWMIAGEPEVRSDNPAGSFNPFPRATVTASDVDVEPALHAVEGLLVACFLRRYVTYCARRRRFAAMQGAARLLRSLQGNAWP